MIGRLDVCSLNQVCTCEMVVESSLFNLSFLQEYMNAPIKSVTKKSCKFLLRAFLFKNQIIWLRIKYNDLRLINNI